MHRPFVTSLYVLIFILTFTSCKKDIQANQNIEPIIKEIPFAIVIHGGAGAIKKEYMTSEKETAYKIKLQEALHVGYEVLKNGGTSVKAVKSAINIMEDSPMFNAGKGSVFNSLGKQEMDASIMDGKTLNTGAVAGVSHIKNPINAAILVKDSTHHVFLSGKGAEEFAKQHGIKMVDASYFYTEKRYQSLLREQAKKEKKITKQSAFLTKPDFIDEHKKGTVGAVAIDKDGNIAAGTSTGGMTNKKYGRIGDSPIIGAGTYANNLTCGVSCTGTGEFFIRTLAAHETSNLIQYKNITLEKALHEVIFNQIETLGGDGGMIAIDKFGNIAWEFNTEGMFRGYRKSNGDNIIEFYKK